MNAFTLCFGWGVCGNRLLALMIHRFAAGSDRVVRVDHQTFGKSVLTVKVGALHVRKGNRKHLIADTMGNVGGEKAPFVAAAKLLRRKKEKTDLLVGPVACPLLDISMSGEEQTYLAPRDDKSMCWGWIEDTFDSSPLPHSTFHNTHSPTVPKGRRFGFTEGASSISVIGSSATGGSPSKGIPFRFATTGSTELTHEKTARSTAPVIAPVDTNGKGDSRKVSRII